MRVYNLNVNNGSEPVSEGLIKTGSKYKSKFGQSISNFFRDSDVTGGIVNSILGGQQSDTAKTNNYTPKIPGKVPEQEKDSLVGDNSPLRTTVSSNRSTPVRKGDSVSNALTKLYSLLKSAYDRKQKEKEISDLFWEHYEAEKERRHNELLEALGVVRPTGKKGKATKAITAPEGKGLGGLLPSALRAAGKAITNVFSSFVRAGRANVLLAAMIELTRQAGDADLNNEKQGIVEPIKNTITKLSEGDFEGALDEIGNFNVYTAAARTGLEFSKVANEATGKAEQIKKIREDNLNPEKDSESTKFFKADSWDKSVKHYEKMLQSAPDKDKDAIRKILDQLKKNAPTAQQVPTPPPTERVVEGSKQYADNQLPTPPAAQGTQVNSQKTAISGGDSSTIAGQTGVRNPEETVNRVNDGTTVVPR